MRGVKEAPPVEEAGKGILVGLRCEATVLAPEALEDLPDGLELRGRDPPAAHPGDERVDVRLVLLFGGEREVVLLEEARDVRPVTLEAREGLRGRVEDLGEVALTRQPQQPLPEGDVALRLDAPGGPEMRLAQDPRRALPVGRRSEQPSRRCPDRFR